MPSSSVSLRLIQSTRKLQPQLTQCDAVSQVLVWILGHTELGYKPQRVTLGCQISGQKSMGLWK